MESNGYIAGIAPLEQLAAGEGFTSGYDGFGRLSSSGNSMGGVTAIY
jgi:hypothetical protein